MIESDTLVLEERLLRDEDFPDDYVHMAHPADYKRVPQFRPRFVYHSKHGRHDRLIARVAWRTNDGAAIPMSFVCDTGAPSSIYLSPTALSVLDKAGLLLMDEDLEMQYVTIHVKEGQTFSAAIDETPSVHKHANILGLRCLMKLHFRLEGESFGFDDDFTYL